MAIVSLNIGNLTLEVNTLKNRLAIGEKEKAMLQEELGKERDFQKGYKHNVEIVGKIGQRLSRKIKCSLKNYRMRIKSSRVAHG
jgi:bacterioferritin (cytochrome b1)